LGNEIIERLILPNNLDEKYKQIFSRERSKAAAVTAAVIKPWELSVWDVVMPVVLVVNFIRFKKDREIFAENLLFTKDLALKAAFDMAKDAKSKREVVRGIERQTAAILGDDRKGIYSPEIRVQQIKEVELLIEHYSKLLESEGSDYDSLVAAAYRNPQDLRRFFAKLGEVEREVILAASRTLGAQSSPEIVSGIEEATQRVRSAEVERIFGPESRQRNA
jgi:hypothetical protein